jgi:hypothetical protein
MHDECSLLGKCEWVFCLAYIMNAVLMFYLGHNFANKKRHSGK